MFRKPALARCDDRSIQAKTHPSGGSPEEWFDNSILEQVGLFGISFDFFVNWSSTPPVVTPVIWIKLILENYEYPALLEDLNTIIKDELGEIYLKNLLSFGEQYKLNVQFILFPKR